MCVWGGANVRSPFVEHAQPNRRHATFTRRTGGILHHRLPRHDTALSYIALAGASSTGLMGYAGLRWAESRTFPPPPSSSRTVAPSRQLPPSRSHHRGAPAPRTCDLNPNTHPFNGPLPGTTQVSRYQGGNVTSAGWQVTLCDPMWHVSSRSGVATVRTAIHLLLTYLLNRKVKPIWILLEQETVSGSDISWAICKSAPRSRQITTPTATQVFYRPDAVPAAQPTVSKH